MSTFIPSLVTLLCSLSCMQASAGIYETAAEMDLSQERAESCKEEIHAGKIIAKSHYTENWADYASATLIGRPGDRESRTILSCTHLHTARPCDLYVFCDYNGVMHEVEEIIDLCEDSSKQNAFNDISLYYLKDPISFNCQTEIATNSQLDINLKSISYGWSITKNFQQSHTNNYGQNPYLLENDFQIDTDGCYKHNYLADRLMTKMYFENNFSHRYIARDTLLNTHQLYHHDSGSSWFTKNERDNLYTLTALSSRGTFVSKDVGNPNDPDQVLGELAMDFFESQISLKMLKLQTEMPCQDILTPLAPHRDWIYSHCY